MLPWTSETEIRFLLFVESVMPQMKPVMAITRGTKKKTIRRVIQPRTRKTLMAQIRRLTPKTPATGAKPAKGVSRPE